MPHVYPHRSPSSVSLYALDVAARPPFNFLLNGGMWLAQRQAPATATTIAQDKYGPDRWRSCRENADLSYQRVDTSGALETGITSRYYGKWYKDTNTGKLLICQPLESIVIAPLLGRTITWQCKLKSYGASDIYRMALLESNSSATADVIPANIIPTTWGADTVNPTFGANLAIIGSTTLLALTTAWQLCVCTVTVPTNSKNLIVAIWSDSKELGGVAWVAMTEAGLYDGAAVRDWLPTRTLDEEISSGQRYYEKSGNTDSSPTRSGAYDLEMTCIATTTADGVQYGQWPWLVLKRTAPTVTIHPYTTGTNSGRVSDNGGTDLAANSGIHVGGSNRLALQNNSGGTVTTNGLILFKYEADAEL